MLSGLLAEGLILRGGGWVLMELNVVRGDKGFWCNVVVLVLDGDQNVGVGFVLFGDWVWMVR